MWRWLKETRKLQQRVYGEDPAALESDALADFIIWNHTALIKELSEALDECTWKPWIRQKRGQVNRQAVIEELVDAAHFLGNWAVAVGCTDDEWTRCYRRKIHLNTERQKTGYAGRCLRCKKRIKPGRCTPTMCGNDAIGWVAISSLGFVHPPGGLTPEQQRSWCDQYTRVLAETATRRTQP